MHPQYGKSVEIIQDIDINEIEEIGSGGYTTVYTAKYKNVSKDMLELVALKRFKKFEEMTDLFIFEVSNP